LSPRGVLDSKTNAIAQRTAFVNLYRYDANVHAGATIPAANIKERGLESSKLRTQYNIVAIYAEFNFEYVEALSSHNLIFNSTDSTDRQTVKARPLQTDHHINELVVIWFCIKR
jgi:hypothetical protein